MINMRGINPCLFMKKKLPRSSSSTACAAAILAGGVLFTGPAASAAIVFSEDFEGINAFGMPTYAYSQNYTLPNALTPDGGLRYGHGGPGVNGQASTNFFPLLTPISLTVGTGVSAAQIDAGQATYDFRAQFSTYRLQNDWSQVSISFRDAFNTELGTPVILGGEAFVAALASGPNPLYQDARAWGESGFQGVIPTGSRTLEVILSATKTPGGLVIDGYVDNIFLSVVPEPTTFALIAVAGLACLRHRRRPR
jgi:hypothetical protein